MRSTLWVLPGVVYLLASAAGSPPAKDPFTPQQREYWALQRVERPAVPRVADGAETGHPVDAFVLKQLEGKGLGLTTPADKITLLRRASFDLTGLPPTPEDVEAFLADRSADAFDKVVDRLLASPRYGERWARHWLDLARFAESTGLEEDATRPNAWRYRSYVIDAFNNDKPYDRFIQEQIAGDELWPGDTQARIATAFNRLYPDTNLQPDLYQRRQEILNDITDTVGAVFLGMTFGCARCHDHKFDPILQTDYYRLQAFFANARADDRIPLWPQDRIDEYNRKLAVWEEKTKDIRQDMSELLQERRKVIEEKRFGIYPPEIQEVLTKPAAERTPLEQLIYLKAEPHLFPTDEEVAQEIKPADKDCWRDYKRELEKFAHLHPGELPMGTGIRDVGRQAPGTHVLAVGVHTAPLDEVQPGFLSILDAGVAPVSAPDGMDSTGRRTALARWLTDPSNPLTARVMVNRIWHYHFGQGIAATPSDFGLMGERPTHPELLDWLADEFVHSGWSIKHLHRLIMTSQVYQQASAYREEASKADPFNRLLWRFPRQRLEGEVIRDSALSVAGLLNDEIGGPSVFPPFPAGMEPPRKAGWEVSGDSAEHHRRSIYIFTRRNILYPLMEVLDLPDTNESCSRRSTTTTALQALSLLNDQQVLGWAQSFAGRVMRLAGHEIGDQIETAYRLAYSRKPDPWERDAGHTFFRQHGELVANRVRDGEQLALPVDVPAEADPAHAATLVDFCHILLNANEFVYQN